MSKKKLSRIEKDAKKQAKVDKRIKTLENKLVSTVEQYTEEEDKYTLPEIMASLVACLKGISNIQLDSGEHF